MVPTTNTAQMETPFRTTTPSAPATTTMTAKQIDPVNAHKSTSSSDLQHTVHMSTSLQNRFAEQVNC